MPAFQYGTQYRSLMNQKGSNTPVTTALGSTGQFEDMMGLVAPPDNSGWLNMMQGLKIGQDTDLGKQKFDIFKNLLGNFQKQMGGTGSFQSHPLMNVPAPNYMGYQPVYSQGQVDAQSGLQRANLLNQADNQSRSFNQDLGSRGFSPMSPFAMLNQQSNMMRANSGAAANETNLNFNAASANSDARLKTGGINAGIYGDYARAVGQQNQVNSQFDLQHSAQSNDLLKMLLSGLAG